MAVPQHILALRFSALGDVAMTVPVLKLLLQQYPNLEITLVSAPFHKPLFTGIDRLHFYGADIKKDFKGAKGLYNLSQRLKKDIAFDAVADLHDVLRTKIIRKFLPGATAVINKGRKQKKELTRAKNKKLRPLKTSFERYADVFEKLGYPIKLLRRQGIVHLHANDTLLDVPRSGYKFIGIAPFAKHASKTYPLEKMKLVVELLQQKPGMQILLFGSRDEAPILQDWKGNFDNVTVIAGRYAFEDELNIISQLHLMVSMDSANMHLASLYGVPVVSVWGGTHPYLGFYGWGQDIDNAVQLALDCRPSSVFGNKPCPVHGVAGCMQGISPQMIVDKTEDVLTKPMKPIGAE